MQIIDKDKLMQKLVGFGFFFVVVLYVAKEWT